MQTKNLETTYCVWLSKTFISTHSINVNNCQSLAQNYYLIKLASAPQPLYFTIHNDHKDSLNISQDSLSDQGYSINCHLIQINKDPSQKIFLPKDFLFTQDSHLKDEGYHLIKQLIAWRKLKEENVKEEIAQALQEKALQEKALPEKVIAVIDEDFIKKYNIEEDKLTSLQNTDFFLLQNLVSYYRNEIKISHKDKKIPLDIATVIAKKQNNDTIVFIGSNLLAKAAQNSQLEKLFNLTDQGKKILEQLIVDQYLTDEELEANIQKQVPKQVQNKIYYCTKDYILDNSNQSSVSAELELYSIENPNALKVKCAKLEITEKISFVGENLIEGDTLTREGFKMMEYLINQSIFTYHDIKDVKIQTDYDHYIATQSLEKDLARPEQRNEKQSETDNVRSPDSSYVQQLIDVIGYYNSNVNVMQYNKTKRNIAIGMWGSLGILITGGIVCGTSSLVGGAITAAFGLALLLALCVYRHKRNKNFRNINQQL